MKKIFSAIIMTALSALMLTGCIEEVVPQNGTPSLDQVSRAPGSFENLVANLTGNLSGKRLYSSTSNNVWDYGYTSLFLTRDVEGQDIVAAGSNNHYSTWYSSVQYLAEGYARTQLPWTYYYGWINDCNVVLKNAGAVNYAEPEASKAQGAGIAYAMRAMFYLDLARMYAAKPYIEDHNALTTIKADEVRTIDQARNQERMTWEEAFEFILKDLDCAEKYLAGYQRADKYTPDVSVVYGLKARTYLEKGDWAKAEEYAKKAQQGYQMMSRDEYLSHDNGFNTPNSSWMFATRFKNDDPSIISNDGDDSWGSVMIPENGFDCGYAANYGGVNVIDHHLYSSIPKTDFRRMCWVDFKLDEMEQPQAVDSLIPYAVSYDGSYDIVEASKLEKKDPETLSTKEKEMVAKLKTDRKYATRIYAGGVTNAGYGLGGYSMKFRNAAGKADVKYEAWCVSVPLMRVEEMKLIEAEAAGMQDEARGKQLLEAFAKTRDPQFEYGKHNEAYYNNSTSAFQNEVWWQRRVELWGEGFATFDIKRLNKGIIRSYKGTNHLENARWNTREVPNWMVWAFVGTEADYNGGMTHNPNPIQPTEDSQEYAW